MTEFDLIKKYFAAQHYYRSDVILGIGDDAAIVQVPDGHQLVITTDTLVNKVHFPENTTAFDIGHKSLAVNLSDLAAMGASPAWVSLAITLPAANEAWIQDFCNGFFSLANRFQTQLIGGDLTQGPLSITVQALGLIPRQQALLRSNAKAGDLIYVTGTLGDAGLALQVLQNKMTVAAALEPALLDRLNRPEPRLLAGKELRSLAHAVIDLSDGLAADLGHILESSAVGATLYVDKLPLSQAVTQALSREKAVQLALCAGDDYELCFTVPPEKQSALEARLPHFSCPVTCIGRIQKERDFILSYSDGSQYHGPQHGYQHFSFM